MNLEKSKKAKDDFRRKYPRREFKHTVGLLYRGAYHFAEGAQVGEGGLLLYLDIPIEIGENLVVNFQIPGGDFVCVRGAIRNFSKREDESNPYSYGISFENLKFAHRREIRHFVSTAK